MSETSRNADTQVAEIFGGLSAVTRQVSKNVAIKVLSRAIETADQLITERNWRSKEYDIWKRDTRVAIEHVFGVNSQHASELPDVEFTYYIGQDFEAEHLRAYLSALSRSKMILTSMAREVNDFWSDSDASGKVPDMQVQSASINGTRVFVVHGHDDGLKETVARYLEKLGLTAVILHEQANGGKTVIEKFEDHADCTFAIALFTPDDFGGSKSLPDTVESRARQNVVFEFGYFVGKLGRSIACAIVKGDVATPSDIAGVVYIKFDSAGAWRSELAKEMQNTGMTFDLAKAI